MSKIFNNKLENIDFDIEEDFSKLLESSADESGKKEKTVVKGVITKLDKDVVTVDIGMKDEGRISMKEFVQYGKLPDLSVGDEIDVYIQSYENYHGGISLSRSDAVRENSWKILEKAMEEKTPIDGMVFGRVKGGLTVDLNGVIAFLPGSQVDTSPVKDISGLLGVVQPFIVLKVDKEQGNVVVSRRAIIEESRAEARDEALSKISVGEVLEGTVKNITDYGAFVDLGSIDGLLHITDISWNKINHPSEVLAIGQKINVKVIKYDKESKRISLGVKQLEKNTWEGLDERYPKNIKMKGTVTNVIDYGIFVKLEPGVEGLVHLSEFSWVKPTQPLKKLVKEGQEVEFMVLDIDIEKHRISLGMKQCRENIWDKFSERYPIGTKVEGKVEKVTDFGLFVNFGEEVNGLVHANDLTWVGSPDKELKKYKVEDEVKAVVIAIDSDKGRVNLGIKQIEKDPFEAIFADLKKGKIVTCRVKAIESDGISVEIADQITSFVKRSDLATEKIEQRPDRFAVGDRVDAKIVHLDKATRKVALSIKSLEREEQQKKIKEFGSVSSGASLGDILGEAISEVNDKQGEDKKS